MQSHERSPVNTRPLRERLLNERDLDIDCLIPGSVEETVLRHMRQAGAAGTTAYNSLLDAMPDEYQAFVQDLIKPPERFFGDPALAALIENTLLPKALISVKHKGRARIWIPQCGPGYLAYDIALLVSKLLPESANVQHIRIVATDRSGVTLAAARRQDYPTEAFDRLNDDGWPIFQTARGARIPQQTRSMILFGEHDFVKQPSLPNVDLVLCIGYLPLLDPLSRVRAKSKLIHALSIGGELVLGRGEIVGIDAAPPTPEQPFSVFTKAIAHPLELQSAEIAAGEIMSGRRPTFINELPLPAFIIDEADRFVYANDPARWALGRTDEDLTGRSIADLEPRELLAPIAEAVAKSRSEGQPVASRYALGWIGAVAPLGSAEKTGSSLLAVMLPTKLREGVLEDAPPGWLSTRQAAAVREARAAAEIWAHEQRTRQLYKQTAVVTENLFNRTEQLNRAKDELERRHGDLFHANEALKLEIENRRRAERELKQSYERERRIADTLQLALLPPVQEQIDGYLIGVRYEAVKREIERAAAVGGDFYHASLLAGGRYFLAALGDASGKGLETAVYSSMARHIMLGFVSETPEPDRLLTRLNDALAAHGADGQFVTLAYLLLELETGRVLYGNAGHEPLVYRSGSTGEVQYLMPTGRALGIDPGASYSARTLDMTPGSVLLAYTDGISEAGARTIPPDPFDEEGIAKVVSAHALESPTGILDAIYKAAERRSKGKLTDDATSLLIKRAH